MVIVDLATSSFILLTVINCARKNRSCPRLSWAQASPAEPLKEFTHGRDWDEQSRYSRRTRKVKLGRERKWLSVKTTELESDTHRKKFEISMRKTINPAFLPVFFHFSLGVILLFSWWFWWWRDSRVYWVWKINCWSELHMRKLDTWKFLFDCRRCWNSAVWVNNLNATSQFSVHSSGCTYRLIVI